MQKIVNSEPYVEKQPKIDRKVWDIIEVVMYCLIALLIAYLIVKFVAQRTVVDGQSMYNTLVDGDNIIVEKLSYTFGEVERFDVVVFPYYDEERDEEVYYIKRIIGMPGETIAIHNGLIYIIDEETREKTRIEENYGYYIDGQLMQGYDATEGIEIPEGCYFVLGDNRNNSKDSRTIGVIKGEDIVGKAWARIYPFSDMCFIE